MSSASRSRRWAVVVLVALACAACGGGSDPRLVAIDSTPTPVATTTSSPSATAVPTPTPVVPAEPTATPAPTPTPVPALARGVTDETISIAVVKTAAVFGDVELGVAARLGRLNADGGIAGRIVEIAEVIDDGGDVERLVVEAERLVEEASVFAVVLASAVPDPAATDVLESAAIPFFGWGFAPGFCEPNVWGFGFNGCLVGQALGLPGSVVDPSPRELVDALADGEPTVVLVVSDDAAGDAARSKAEQLWGDRLVGVVIDRVGDEGGSEAVVAAVADSGAEVALLSLGLDRAIDLKAVLRDGYDGLVVDDVSYLPGLLADFAIAEQLEGSYAISQFPPQEEYREVTGVLATDLQAVGGELVYSQAVSLGYWSTDLLAGLLDAVGDELDTATFDQRVNVEGVRYESGLDGAPCPIDTDDVRRSPTGGAALVVVRGGIYFPAVSFTCFR